MEGMSERTSLLVGDEGIERLRNASAIVVGNGAVGGYALEGLVRAGIGRIRTVDGDVFSASNMNRQILATTDTVGRPKAEVACERARSVNPAIDIEPLMLHVDDDTIPTILNGDFDVLIDAIDTVRCKVMLLRAASEKGIRTFSSMGAARHMRVDTVRIGRLSETSVCPVAAAVRKGMRGFDASMITCVYNIEPPIACDGGRDDHGKSVLGSMPTVPAVMGMTLANEAISFLLSRRRRRKLQWFPAKTLNETSPKTSMQHQEIGRRRYVLMEYIPRLADKELAADLKIFGAVVISGPRWTGKTATAARVAGSVLMMQDPDSGSASLMTAELKPSRLLEGKTPRLIDEWQEAPQLWDAVRLTVDDRDEPGQFILTGSAAADRRRIRHSGAGRFCEIRMGTMTLFESGDSSGTVSLKGLFDGGVADAVCDRSLEEMAHLVVRGGWPEAAGRDTGAAIRIIDGYCDILTCPDATGSPSERHDGSRFAAVMHSLSRSVSAPLSKTGIIADVSSKGSISISENTLNAYLDDLGRAYILDNLMHGTPSSVPGLRSESRTPSISATRP